ncbi:3-keto-5-aminohexanoate cleavage protein [Gordonia pseudamarae]|jgi:3-keto-5-aminohexanoate cleavage enzyme|uniref:3-keto-5-aminohexanoate cleavage protein n=1 Tax=Gordonia pseudamarae TaxID=2831662 RepID=A0ABX6IE11_9ACTN|nr:MULTISPECIES: 3-keto-5-aminohexanoate cleavage protein [Gordonia]MBD0022412.1 3-keto-5-aminohexanoate cleavage protein [Gordonia sp. (in: high G+C Gram-positive bacteria)]QHN25106.1 3-keto-5-aminohexanoate cleavage protein [Gordonia pseudamarae]QHN34039.1 3-keto-5-aminohexanoate cleavage protein [Gordonia pseudamarae]
MVSTRGVAKDSTSPAGDSVIIEVAVNGSTPRSVNRHVPRMPEEIAADVIACAEHGASIAHNHNDEPMFTDTGIHSVQPYIVAWERILRIHPDVLLYPTLAAGARDIAIEDRWAHIAELARRGLGGMTLVDPGSVNLGLVAGGPVPPIGARGCYQNTLDDTAYMFAETAKLGAAPSISIFEPGYLRTTLAWHRAGLLPLGAFVKLYFGGVLEFGLPPTRAGLEAYLELLEPSGLPWSVALLGGDIVDSGLAAMAIERGGHIRVGLEDYAGDGQPTNVELVDRAVELIHKMGCVPSTTTQTRDILGIPGAPLPI